MSEASAPFAFLAISRSTPARDSRARCVSTLGSALWPRFEALGRARRLVVANALKSAHGREKMAQDLSPAREQPQSASVAPEFLGRDAQRSRDFYKDLMARVDTTRLDLR